MADTDGGTAKVEAPQGARIQVPANGNAPANAVGRAPGGGSGGTATATAAGAAQEIRAGLGASSRLRDQILPSFDTLALADVEAGAALRRMEQAIARTAFLLPADLADPRAKLVDEYAKLKPDVDARRAPRGTPEPDGAPVLYTKDEAKAQPPPVGSPPKPGSHAFKDVDKAPAGIEVAGFELEIQSLPSLLVTILAPGAPKSTERVSVKLLLQTDHKVALYVGRTLMSPGAKPVTKGLVAVIDLVEVATNLAVLGLAVTGKLAAFFTGSKEQVLTSVGKYRVKLLLSAKRANGVNDFVVIDVYQLLKALADDDWSAFRPEEMQLELGKGKGKDPAVTVARYQGDQHKDTDAFKGRGLRMGGSALDPIVVPELRTALFGEKGPAASQPLRVSGASDGKTVTLAVARGADDTDGAAITFDLFRVFEIVKKTLGTVLPHVAKGIDKLFALLEAGAKGGAKVLELLGGLFTLRVPSGEGWSIGFSLDRLLAAMGKLLAGGGDLVQAFLGLIPSAINIGTAFIEPVVDAAGKLAGKAGDAAGAVGKLMWDGLQKVGDLIPLAGDAIGWLLGELGDAGGALLGLAGDAAAFLGDVGLEVGLVVVDKTKMIFGFIIDLLHKKKKKKRIGFTVVLGKILGLLARIGAALGKLAGKQAYKTGEWFAKHASLGSDLVLRVFLDDPPKPGGNRIGMALLPIIKSGGDLDELHLTETFLDGSLTDISYGTVVDKPDPSKPDAPTDPKAKPPVPGSVRISRPEGGSVALSYLSPPKWMQVAYGIPKTPLVTELIVGSSGAKGALGGFHAHIWAQRAGGKEAFDIALALPVPKIIAKRMPSIKPELLRIDNERSKNEHRLVVQIGNVDTSGSKPKGITGWMSWSLDQIFAAESFDDALTPEQLKVDDGTWGLVAGTKVDLKEWGNKPVTSMVPPSSVLSWFPAAHVDVFVKQTGDRFGMFLADHSSLATRSHAVGVGFDVSHKRLEQLKAKLPKAPGFVKKALPLELEAKPDGLKIWLGPKPKDATDTKVSWVQYSWSTLVDIMASGADLENLVPDQAHLDAPKAGLALHYSTLTAADVKVDPKYRVKVSELELVLGDLVRAFGVTNEHYLQIDPKASTLAGTRVAVHGWIYTEVGKDKTKSGWKVGLEVDAIKLLSRFVPKRVRDRLADRKPKKGGFDAGFTPHLGKTGKDGKPLPGPEGQPSLEVWMEYAHTRRGKTKEFKVTAGWTLEKLLEILVNLDDLDENPSMAKPTSLAGTAGNGSFEIELKSSGQPVPETATRMDYLEMPLMQVLGQFIDPDVVKNVQLHLDENLSVLPAKMAQALKDREDLVLASAYIVLPGSGGPGDNYSLKISVKPGAIASLAMMIPGGFYVKLGKFLIDFVQDPEAKLDDMFYTVTALPLLLKHRDIFKKIDWDSLSAKDVAMMVLLNDNDTKGMYMSLKAFDKLVEAGHIDKDKLPKITGEMARKAAGRDQDAAREQIEKIYRMPMDELKKTAKMRKDAGSQEQYEKIIAFASSISVEHQVLMRKLVAMYEKKGIPLDTSDAKNWSPEKAIQKLGKLEETLKRLEAGEVGNRIEAQLRKGDKSGEGRDGDRAAEVARNHLDGKHEPGTPKLDVNALRADQLAQIVRDGYVVVDGPDGKKVVHHATPDERKQAKEALAKELDVKPDDALATYDAMNKQGLLGIDAIETLEQLRRAGVKLSEAQVDAATVANPKQLAAHKHGPEFFGAPGLAVDSIAYVVHIAKLQLALRLTKIDGVAGPGMVKLIEAQRKLKAERDKAAKAADAKAGKKDGKDGKDGKGGGDKDGDKEGGDSEHDGADGDAGEGGKGGGGGRGDKPSGAWVPIGEDEVKSLPYWDAINGKLVLPEDLVDTFTNSSDPNRKIVQNSKGETGLIYAVGLKQRKVSRDNPGADPQMVYQIEFSAKPAVPDEDGEFGRDFKVYTRPMIFFVDLNHDGGRGGYARKPAKLKAMSAALDEAIGPEGAVGKTTLKFDEGGPVVAEIENVELVGGNLYRVTLSFRTAPPGLMVYDPVEGRYVDAVGSVTVHHRVKKDKAAAP